MRIISILVGLLILAYLSSKQATPEAPSRDLDTVTDNKEITLPKVPTAPENVKDFKTDINKFIQDTASERNKELGKIKE